MREDQLIERCEPAKFVFIGIASYTFHPSAPTMISMCNAISLMDACKINYHIQVEPCNGYIDDARNILATFFKHETACTDFVSIDDDLGFRQEDFLKLITAKRPVVGAAYRRKSEKVSWTGRVGKQIATLDAEGLIEVSDDGYVPTGFMRINRAVFEALPVEEYDHIDGSKILEYFTAGRQAGNGRRTHVTEDVEFCNRWHALGGKIHMIPDATFDHIGIQSFSGNWKEWQTAEVPA